MDDNLIITIQEARDILGKTAETMTDEQVEGTVRNLDGIAKAALEDARKKKMEHDAAALAELIYDIYQGKKMRKPRKDAP